VVWHFTPQQAGVAHSQPSVSGAVAALQSEDADAPVSQVYEHVVPLQLAADAFVRLHLSPQALQFCVVLRRVHVPLHVVSWQVHEPFEQSGVGCAQAVWFCQVPLALQFCVVLPLQSV
jgi:hypothetical protein